MTSREIAYACVVERHESRALRALRSVASELLKLCGVACFVGGFWFVLSVLMGA